jgi:hypothetical protein
MDSGLAAAPRLGMTIVLAAEELAAIDRDRLAGDPIGERRDQEQGDTRDLFRVPQPAERDRAQDRVVELRVVGLVPLPAAAGKLDRAGADAVDSDALLGERGARFWVYCTTAALATP